MSIVILIVSGFTLAISGGVAVVRRLLPGSDVILAVATIVFVVTLLHEKRKP